MSNIIIILKGIAFTYMQSAGVVAYAGLQWLLLYKFTILGGYKQVGDFSLAQALAGPVFGFCAFSLRPLWISGVVGNLKFADVAWIRFISTGVAIILFISICLLTNTNINLLIILIVLSFKIQESISDIIYARFDKSNQSQLAGALLLFKSTAISSVLMLTIFMQLSLVTTTQMIVTAVVISLIIEVVLAQSGRIPNFRLPSRISLNLASILPSILWTSFSCLIVALSGFLPRYGLEIIAGREAVGYYSIITLPATLMMLITIGYSQSSLNTLSQYLLNKNIIEFKKYLSLCLLKIFIMSLGVLIILFIVEKSTLYIFVNWNPVFSDMTIAFMLTIPLFLIQLLSYAAFAASKVKIMFLFSLFSLIFQILIFSPAHIAFGIFGAIATQTIGSFVQGFGFVYVILTYVKQYHKTLNQKIVL